MSAREGARASLQRVTLARRLLALGLLVLLVPACGTAPWNEPSASVSPPPGASVSPSRTNATATPGGSVSVPPSRASSSPEPVQNDLATGSAKRTLLAGGVRVKVNYWSTLDMGEWTESASKPLDLSASATFVDGSEQNIFMSKASVNMAVNGAKGPLEAPERLVDEARVSPGYLMKSPSSYIQVFTIPALAAGATSVKLTMTYELLVQSAPKAKTFSKQTASNELVIPIQS